MQKQSILLLGMLSGGTLSAVQAQQSSYPLKTEFLDSANVVLPSAVGATYRRETEQLDSVKGIVRTYYLDGRRSSVSEVELRKEPIPNGMYESWFDNGQLNSHEVFEHGKRVGDMQLYYRSGQLKRQAHYTGPFESTGKCFAADGQDSPFFEYEQLPVYPDGDGGQHAIVAAIQRGVRYPKDALRARREGRVYVSFTVNRNGRVADIKVVKGLFPSIDAVVVQGVNQLKTFKPGQQDGKAVAVSYTVPVTFRIQ
jgi:protein TonB